MWTVASACRFARPQVTEVFDVGAEVGGSIVGEHVATVESDDLGTVDTCGTPLLYIGRIPAPGAPHNRGGSFNCAEEFEVGRLTEWVGAADHVQRVEGPAEARRISLRSLFSQQLGVSRIQP